MIHHLSLGNDAVIRSKSMRRLIRQGEIMYGGNKKLKIYGTLHCTSGKRMKADNRVFFATAAEAIQQGYRPCGHCMREEYKQWKKN